VGHERRRVRLQALANGDRVAAEDRPAPFAAGITEPGIEGVKTIGDRQRRHEVPAGITNQSLHLALVITLARPTEPVVEQVMALQFCEHLRA
jgi:hypothetical protein